VTTDLVEYTGPDPTGGRLVAWAQAADAAWTLANRLVWTDMVPVHFRATNVMNPADQQRVAGNAAAALLWGDELHLDPIASLRSIYFVKGTPAMYTKAVVGLALARGHRIWTELETDDTVTVVGHRKDEPDHLERVTYTAARAQAEGLTRNDQYRVRPRAMLWARAASIVASRIAADVLMGVPEEFTEDTPAPAGPPRPIARRTAVRPAPDPDPVGLEAGPNPTGPVTSPTAGVAGEVSSDTTPLDDADVIPPEGEATPPGPEPMTGAQRRMMFAMFGKIGLGDDDHRDARLRYAIDVIGRDIESSNDLTGAEARDLIDALVREAEGAES
jgi:hypothetical protein